MTTSRTGRLLRRLVGAACARPVLTVAIATLVTLVSGLYAATTLEFATSTRALLPQHAPYVQRFIEFDREFGELDDLIIAVQAPSLPEATLYAGRLVRELRTNRVPLGRMAYRIDPKQFEGRALLYLGKDKLAEIRDRIFDYQEFMEDFAGRPTLDQLIEGLATQVAGAFVTGFLDLGLGPTAGASDFRFIEDLVTQMATRIDKPAPYRSPWGALFSAEDDGSAGYFLSDDQRLLFILAEPAIETGNFTGNRHAIEATRSVIASLRPQFPSVNVGVTGKPALSNDEMTTAFDERSSNSPSSMRFSTFWVRSQPKPRFNTLRPPNTDCHASRPRLPLPDFSSGGPPHMCVMLSPMRTISGLSESFTAMTAACRWSHS